MMSVTHISGASSARDQNNMTKKTKLLERIKNNPKDVKFSEVQKLLKDIGFNERQPRGRLAYA
jgi:hypothetical protein